MIINVYSIRDACVGFGNPFVQPNDDVALRTMRSLLVDPQSEFSRSPKDYSIWRVGTFDTDTGIIDSVIPEMLSRGETNG